MTILGARDWKDWLRLHMEAQIVPYSAALLLFVLGVALGCLAVSALSPLQRADLLQYVAGFLQGVKGGVVAGPHLMRQATLANLRALVAAWCIGASLLGVPVVCLLLVLRGFAIGFTVAFLTGELGARGLWLTLIGVVPPNLVIVPAFLLLAVGSFELVARVVRHRRSGRAFRQAYGGYLVTGAVALLLLLVGSVLEAYVSPYLLGALWPYLAG